MSKTFDPAVYDLAASFCPEGTPPSKVRELAAGIQDYIEDWLSIEQRELEIQHQAGDQRLP
jgi:hypothetical protein